MVVIIGDNQKTVWLEFLKLNILFIVVNSSSLKSFNLSKKKSSHEYNLSTFKLNKIAVVILSLLSILA